MIVSQVLDELGISLDQELSGITPGLEQYWYCKWSLNLILSTFLIPFFITPTPVTYFAPLSLFFQTKKKAVAGAESKIIIINILWLLLLLLLLLMLLHVFCHFQYFLLHLRNAKLEQLRCLILLSGY